MLPTLPSRYIHAALCCGFIGAILFGIFAKIFPVPGQIIAVLTNTKFPTLAYHAEPVKPLIRVKSPLIPVFC